MIQPLCLSKLGFLSVLNMKLNLLYFSCRFKMRVGVMLHKLLMVTVCVASCRGRVNVCQLLMSPSCPTVSCSGEPLSAWSKCLAIVWNRKKSIQWNIVVDMHIWITWYTKIHLLWYEFCAKYANMGIQHLFIFLFSLDIFLLTFLECIDNIPRWDCGAASARRFWCHMRYFHF